MPTDSNFEVQVGDSFGDPTSDTDGAWWRPWSGTPNFRLLGLDNDNVPIGDEEWAAFIGRLGQAKSTSMNGAVKLDGVTGLPGDQWTQVQVTWSLAKLFGIITQEFQKGDGPEGPAAGYRGWVHQKL